METLWYIGLAYELNEPIEVYVEPYIVPGVDEHKGGYWVYEPVDKNLNVSMPGMVGSTVVIKDKVEAYRTVISRIEAEITALYTRRSELKKVVDL